MGIEKVRNYFTEFGIEDRVLEFDSSSATVELAAKALGCKEEHIAKSLTFKLDDKVILIVTAGDAKINNAKFKNTFKQKAKMLKVDELPSLVGFSVGGVCPFGVNEDVLVYLDTSLKRFTYVYPACGSSNSAIKLTLEELEKYSNFISYVDVCTF